MRTFLYKSLSPGAKSIVENDMDTARKMLIKLKSHFCPTDNVKRQEIINEYRLLCKPPKAQGIEQWLQRWMTMYNQGKDLDMSEFKTSRAQLDFLEAVKTLRPNFANGYHFEITLRSQISLKSLSISGMSCASPL